MLGLRFCARAFSSCGEQGPLFIAVRGPLTVAASPVAERRLSSCGSRAQLLCGMWDLPRPGLEPVSPALAGRFLTTAPPGKPRAQLLRAIPYSPAPIRAASAENLWHCVLLVCDSGCVTLDQSLSLSGPPSAHLCTERTGSDAVKGTSTS